MHRKLLFRRHFTRPAAPPGEFHLHPDATPSKARVIRYNPDFVEEFEPDSIDHLVELLPDPGTSGSVTWIDVQGLGTRDLVERIARHFSLHPLAVADVFNTGQRPKAEEYDSTLFVVVRMCMLMDDGEFRWEQVSLFVGSGWVLTFQEQPGDCLDPLRARIRQGRAVFRASGSDYLATMVVDAVVDGYFPVLDEYAERLEELETRVVQRPDRALISEIYRIKRQLMNFRRSVWPLRDVLNSLVRDRHPLFTPATLLYLRDVADHATQVVDFLESYREVVGSLVEVYLSSLSNRTNEVMRVLTVLASIFIPLTFLAGIYGMNFESDSDHPLNMPEIRWKYGYIAFWILAILLAGTLLVVFRRLGWIGSPRRPPEEN